MIIDALLEFSKHQSITGTADGTNVLDMNQVAPTPGMSKMLDLVVTAEPGFTGKLSVTLKDSDEEGGTFTNVAASGEVEVGEEGAVLVVPVPLATKRYLKVAYDGGGSGMVNAALVWGADSHTRVDGTKAYMR